MLQPIAPDYGQQFLFPPALEDWVPADHPARFLREFVAQLDLAALGFAMPQASEGRPPYGPSLLLVIWLYGYFHGIRSTRKLERACREVLPLVWLSGLIVPDHNSLWRFWRQNQKPLRGVFKQTVQLAVRSGCVGLALQALDGTRIQAAASHRSGWSREYMEKLLAALDAALERTELEVVEANGSEAEPGAYSLPAGLAERQALRQQIQAGLAQLDADGRQHHHPVEPEARRMKIDRQRPFAYNAQAVVDSEAGVVVACEVSRQESDAGLLVPMIEQARENVGQANSTQTLTLADGGYGAGAQLQEAQNKGLAVLVPPAEGTVAKARPYAGERFEYDAQLGTVTCPQGKRLDYEGQTIKEGVEVKRYRCHCRDCPVRQQCTRDPKGREIEIRPYTALVRAMRKRLKEPAVAKQYGRRKELVERCFGHIKEHDRFRRWTVWGLDAVKTQWSLVCATVNLRVLFARWRQGLLGPRWPGVVALESLGRLADIAIDGAKGRVSRVLGWIPRFCHSII